MAPADVVMAGLLWKRRSQVGCCLLIQGVLLTVGLGLERLMPHHAPSPDTLGLARTRG
ncbi:MULTISPECIES: hypothetical protein [unclassified Synechococcus]|uniref:hypothetical protein n=1 Tax=unclassified Synechococcus TaxID=2626047 RepID=UPI0020CC1438|nr:MULTISPECIES: hypothetical protein [unclassified Synechococcus]MCP9874088.1 hypothetical protein [Synechococcus sp. Cruz CV-v-12]